MTVLSILSSAVSSSALRDLPCTLLRSNPPRTVSSCCPPQHVACI